MHRSSEVLLVATFAGVVAATLFVPAKKWVPGPFGPWVFEEYAFAWAMLPKERPPEGAVPALDLAPGYYYAGPDSTKVVFTADFEYRVRWYPYLMQIGAVALLGLCLAIVLAIRRHRLRRRATVA